MEKVRRCRRGEGGKQRKRAFQRNARLFNKERMNFVARWNEIQNALATNCI